MASKGKKKKPQHARSVPVGELVKLAEERLQGGRPEEAIRLLQEVEGQLRRSAVPAGGKGRPSSGAKGQPEAPPLPPHLAAVQPQVGPLLARAFFERALTVSDPSQQIADLEAAVKRAPSESRSHLALGACRLALGQREPAFESIQQARQLAPDDPLVDRAFALGSLATGHTREVKEWLKRRPKASLDAPEQRLAAIRDLIVGHVEAVGDSDRPLQTAAPRPWTPGEAMAARLISSLALLVSGEVARAREPLSALPPLDRNPNRAEAAALATQLFYSGAVQFQAGRCKEAAGDLREALRLARGHAVALPWMDRITPYFHKIAETAIQENDLHLAADLWSQILERDPDDRVAAANFKAVRGARASEAWHGGEYQRAVELWKEALRSNPHDEQLFRSLAIGAEKVGQKGEAIDHWRALAQTWRHQAKRRASEAAFTERLMRLEQHLVQLMLETGRPPAQVLHELESALKIDAADDALRRRYADLLIELGRPEQALKQLEMLERSQGESAGLLAQKGMTLDLLGRHSAARKALARALELEPSHLVARQGYLYVLDEEGLAAEKRGDYERAREICQEQLSLDPNYAPALGHLATLSFAFGDDQQGRSMIARLIEAEPTNPRRYVMAGTIYLAFNKIRLADAEFKRAVEIDPSEPCFYHIGSAYLRSGKIKKALKHFERAAAFGSLEALLGIAGELTEAGYFDEARPFLDQAIAKDPHRPEPHLVKATMWLDMGGIAEAQSELEEAERLAARRSEFAEVLDEIRELKQEIKQMQKLAGALGPLPADMPALPPELLRLFGKYVGRR